MALFKKFAVTKRVKLVIMRNSFKEMERSLIEAARPMGIPTLVIQHGLVGDPNMSDPLCADMIAVWGNASIEWYKRFGHKADRCAVTGNPAYDELYPRSFADNQDCIRKAVCAKLGLDPAKKIITFLTQYVYLFGTCFSRGNKSSVEFKAVLDAVKYLPEAQLIVKLHPFDSNADFYKHAIQTHKAGTKIVLIKEINTLDVLAASDLAVIVDVSTCGLEALILDKPVIAVELHKTVTKLFYADGGAAIGAKSARDIETAIKNALYDEKTRALLRSKRRDFIFNYAYEIDGQATKRVEELIHKLMGSHQQRRANVDAGVINNEYSLSKSFM